MAQSCFQPAIRTNTGSLLLLFVYQLLIISFATPISFPQTDMLRTTQCLIKRFGSTFFKTPIRFASNLEDYSIYDVF